VSGARASWELPEHGRVDMGKMMIVAVAVGPAPVAAGPKCTVGFSFSFSGN
jgi:hypothetical protein